MKHGHALRAKGTQARQHLGGPAERGLGDSGGVLSRRGAP